MSVPSGNKNDWPKFMSLRVLLSMGMFLRSISWTMILREWAYHRRMCPLAHLLDSDCFCWLRGLFNVREQVALIGKGQARLNYQGLGSNGSFPRVFPPIDVPCILKLEGF